jgi:hypothetical protein
MNKAKKQNHNFAEAEKTLQAIQEIPAILSRSMSHL